MHRFDCCNRLRERSFRISRAGGAQCAEAVRSWFGAFIIIKSIYRPIHKYSDHLIMQSLSIIVTYHYFQFQQKNILQLFYGLLLVSLAHQITNKMSDQVEIKSKIRQYLPQWSQLSDPQILLERMVGITNETYKASVLNSSIQPIIFRKFGQSEKNVFLERQSQLFVYLHISDVGLGPKIYFYDGAVRIEQFIESTVLPADKMLKNGYVEEIGFTLSKFHQLKPTSQKIPQQSLIKRVFIKGMEKIISVCHNKMEEDIYTNEEKQLIKLFKEWVSKKEIDFISHLTEKLEEERLVFSHNDLLANNILIQNQNKKVVFIDYEYSCYNYPIFDIANFISQSEFNYDYPDPPYFSINPLKPEDFGQQVRLIEAYVIGKDLTLQEFRQNFQILRKEEKYQAEINRLLAVLPIGKVLHHLMWGWWGIIVCKNPKIQFDYLAFVKRRYDEYHRIIAQFKL